MKDAFGRKLEVGDHVVHAPGSSGYSRSLKYGTVFSFSPKMARVEIFCHERQKVEPYISTIAPDRLIKIEKIDLT